MGQFTREVSHRGFAREFPSEETGPGANPRPRSPDRASSMGQTTDTVPFGTKPPRSQYRIRHCGRRRLVNTNNCAENGSIARRSRTSVASPVICFPKPTGSTHSHTSTPSLAGPIPQSARILEHGGTGRVLGVRGDLDDDAVAQMHAKRGGCCRDAHRHERRRRRGRLFRSAAAFERRAHGIQRPDRQLMGHRVCLHRLALSTPGSEAVNPKLFTLC